MQQKITVTDPDKRCVEFEGANNSQAVIIALGVLFGVFFIGFVAVVILSICLWRRLQGTSCALLLHKITAIFSPQRTMFHTFLNHDIGLSLFLTPSTSADIEARFITVTGSNHPGVHASRC